MPELPEVERFRTIAAAVCLGRTITNIYRAEDEIVFPFDVCGPIQVGNPIAPAVAVAALTGASVLGVHRKGKKLWFELDKAIWPVFSFGMTGSFQGQSASEKLKNSGVELRLSLETGDKLNSQWPPRFTKLLFTMDDGGELAFTNSRRFGRVEFVGDIKIHKALSCLGFDPMHEMPLLDRFYEMFVGRRGTIKGLLLNQSFVAGIGNWIVDEVLYMAGVKPDSKVPSLDKSQLNDIYHAMEFVITTAVSVGAEKALFPADWLFHLRWRGPPAKTVDGLLVRFDKVAGRTTVWVPELQS